MMKEKTLSINWKETLPYVSMQTAYDSVLRESTDVVMSVEIGIDPDHTYGGWYETYDEETGGGDYYAGGVLEITWDAETGQPWLNGYDGCFELPDYIVAKLVENGVKDNL
ncbi:MAG: hypothetical protein GY721_00530 [Deltaproteobacteria bacterium]|nr:hypothetical protein [Deltaproteobacteria bacterium]